jgi:hypothetical protein
MMCGLDALQASLVAMLCFCRGSALRFFGRTGLARWRIAAIMVKGGHDHGNAAMPAMPGSALIVIESELVLRGLKAILDRLPMNLRPRPAFRWMLPLGTKW